MAATLALLSIDVSRRFVTRLYQVTLAGTYTALGDPLDFLSATNTKFLEPKNPGYGATMAMSVISLPNPNGNGYTFRLQKGSTFSNSLLRIYESGADGGDLDEIATATLPAAVSDDANVFVELKIPIGFA